MGGQNVKNTIVEALMHTLAPHPCLGCGKVGSLLCAYCKYDIITEPFVGCIVCGKASRGGICSLHNSPIKRAFVVSERSGALEATINRLKFSNTKAAAKDLALLLHESLPLLPDDTLIVPIPTVGSHIRQRGYDQVELIARYFADFRNLKIARVLKRAGKATQHKLGRTEREVAARHAFVLNDVIMPGESPLLILDDIITTGSTVQQAALLLKAYSPYVWVGALAYQPLD